MVFTFTLRRMAFLAYSAVLFALPFGFLASENGTCLGLVLFCLTALYVRLTAQKRMIRRLGLTPLYPALCPWLSSVLSEYTRKVGCHVPRVYLIPSPSLNAAVSSFSPKESFLIFTQGLLDNLDRAELEAITVRLIVELESSDIKNRSWLTQFLLLLERPTSMEFAGSRSHTRRFYPLGIFLRQLILYPLSWIPLNLLWKKRESSQLDSLATFYTQDKRSLSEGYRKMEAQRERTPLLCPLAFHSLFLVSPSSVDPIAKVFVVSESLNQRILLLEGRATV